MSIQTNQLANQGPRRLARDGTTAAKLHGEVGAAGGGIADVLKEDVRKEGRGIVLTENVDGTRIETGGEDRTLGAQIVNPWQALFGIKNPASYVGQTVDVVGDFSIPESIGENPPQVNVEGQ